MKVWAVIVIIILAVLILGFVGLTVWTEYENTKKQQNNIIHPFTGVIDPTNTGKSVVLTRAPDGRNQIECPVGTKINIIGAWVEVNDPFGECSNPTKTFKATCGDDSNPTITCSNSGDCGDGMNCVAGKCMAKTCHAAGDCGAKACPVNPGTKCTSHEHCGGSPMVCGSNGECQIDPSLGQCMSCNGGKCAQGPTCSNLNSSFQNIACVPTNLKNNCRPRDASAYLAKECNGKQSCSVSWSPTSSKFFGPLPCRVKVSDSEYPLFPIVPGWYGGTPSGKGAKAAKANYNQGYYVHGIYSCILND